MQTVGKNIRKVFFYSLLVLVTVCFVRIFILLNKASFFQDAEEVSELWRYDPIVALYVPSSYPNHRCKHDFETVQINLALVASDASFPTVNSKSYRLSTVCIKRAGKAAMSYKENLQGWKVLQARQSPDKRGRCHDGFKKCGDGFNEQEAAICFPFDVECPITNVLVLPSRQEPPLTGFWELAGTFPHNNHTLHVRRQYKNELPVIDLAFHLTEFDSGHKNMRGVCHDSPTQFLPNDNIVARRSAQDSWDITFPPMCNRTDERYQLIDQVHLSEHFPQNIPLSYPHYERSVDTLRTALQNYDHITMGMYFTREVTWKDSCGYRREALSECWQYAKGCMALLILVSLFWVFWNAGSETVQYPNPENLRFLYDYGAFLVFFVLMSVVLLIVRQVTYLYDVMGSPDCTDTITRLSVQEFLEPAKDIEYTIYAVLLILFVLTVESYAWSLWTYSRFTVSVRTVAGNRQSYLQPIVQYHPPPVPAPLVVANTAGGVHQVQSVNTTTGTTGLHNRGVRHAGH